jgi:hypothetical protein
MVRFIIDIHFLSKEQKTKLLSLYGEKFFLLIKEIKAKKYFSLDYEYLPKIRILLSKHKNLEQLMPVLQDKLPEENLLKVLEVGPLFNLAPINLRSFMLLGLGLRQIQ